MKDYLKKNALTPPPWQPIVPVVSCELLYIVVGAALI